MEKAFNLVEVTRLELTTSWTRTMRATTCATPRRAKKTNQHPFARILYTKTAQIATKLTPFSEKFLILFFISRRGAEIKRVFLALYARFFAALSGRVMANVR